MGDHRIGGHQPSTQLGPPRKLERTTSTGDVRKSLDGEAIQLRKQALLRRSDSTGRLPTQSKDVISDGSTQIRLESGLDASTSHGLMMHARLTPKPEALEKAIAGLKHVPDDERIEKSGLEAAQKAFKKDSKRAGDSAPRLPQHQGMSDQAFNQGVGQLLTPQVRQFERAYGQAVMQCERALPGQLQDAFKDPLKSYLKATATRFGSKTDQGAEDAIQLAAKNWAAGFRPDSDTGLTLAHKTDAELRKLASDMLAGAMDYGPKDMAKLSDRKQHFIAALARGLREGIAASAQQVKDEADDIEMFGSQSRYHNQPVQPAGKIMTALHDMQLELQKSIVNLPANDPMRAGLLASSPEGFSAAIKSQLGAKNEVVMNALLEASRSPVVNESLIMSVRPGSAGNQRVSPANLPGDKRGLTLPDTMTVNGVTYGNPSYLAEGGFANVFSYTHAQSGEQIIVKVNKPGTDSGQAQDLLVEECRAHLALEGAGHPNVTGFKALVRSGSDVYAVQEAVSGGDLNQAKNKLWALREQGALNPETHQLLALALLKDSLEGMRHIQNESQGHHFDLKLPNILLSETGVAKIADFGFAGVGSERGISRLQGNDTPDYKSPELIRIGHQFRRDKQDTAVSNRADTWNAGVMAYTLLVNKDQSAHAIWSKQWDAQREGDIIAFGAQADNRIRPSAPHKDGGQGLGFNPVDKLINGLMRPEADKRSNFAAALQSSLFQDSRLNKPELRQLLALIGTTPSAQQDQAFRLQLAQLVTAINQ